MKFSDVSDSDMKMLGQLINMLQNGEYSLSGKDLCVSADTIRWLQKIGVEAAKAYQESKSPKVVAPETPPVTPSPMLGEGVSIKSMGKSKASK